MRTNFYGYQEARIDGQYVPEHVLIAEAALGKRLPPGVVVHHIDEDRSNNRPDNLLICTIAYHNQLHARMRRRRWLERMFGT